MQHARIALAVLALAAACEEPPAPRFDAVEPLLPPDPAEGFQVSIHATAQPGTEIWRCEIIPSLPGEDPFLYVGEVQSRMNAGVHHADLMALFYTGLDIAPGQYDCQDLYRDHLELMEDGVIVYGAQLPDANIVLPAGVAAAVPRAAPYMLEVHYVNASTEPVDVSVYMNALTMDEALVEDTIAGDANRDFDINVPAGAVDHVEWTRCIFTEDVDVVFLSSHTHELARHFEIKLFDGVNTGALVYENDDWHSPEILQLDPPLHVPAGTGFEYSCLYDNPGTEDVHWGFLASDEMCQFAYVFTPGKPSLKCETVESSSDP